MPALFGTDREGLLSSPSRVPGPTYAVSDDASARGAGPGGVEPSPEFIERMGGLIQDWTDKGVLITAEGVHPSAEGARVRKAKNGTVSAKDGPFSEANEVIGGFGLINAADRGQAVEYAKQYAALFDDVEVEVRQVVEYNELPQSA